MDIDLDLGHKYSNVNWKKNYLHLFYILSCDDYLNNKCPINKRIIGLRSNVVLSNLRKPMRNKAFVYLQVAIRNPAISHFVIIKFGELIVYAMNGSYKFIRRAANSSAF